MKTYSPEAVAFLAECEFLFQKYSEELRATTQPYYLSKAIKHIPNYEYRPDDPLIRETLMEHVGSLPMLAAAFYPHLNNADVDLGKALTMLAIHDIGELITGDEITFTKKANAKDPERDAALSLLHKTYHAAYDDARLNKRMDELETKIDTVQLAIAETITHVTEIAFKRIDDHVGRIIRLENRPS